MNSPMIGIGWRRADSFDVVVDVVDVYEVTR
jgi:hypothetical protein